MERRVCSERGWIPHQPAGGLKERPGLFCAELKRERGQEAAWGVGRERRVVRLECESAGD